MRITLKKFALATVFMILFGGTAFAIEVNKTITVNAPVSKVWEKIGGWCAIKDWHPAVVGCKEKKEGDDMRRILTLDGGGEIIELLKASGDNSYSYIIESSPLPVANYKSTISVAADGDNKTKINWVGNFDAKDKPDDEAQNVITGVYDGGLSSITKMFD
jgi:hypothetical protein